ncbi:ArnT family glycosyltransferase [Desulfurobacterium atlanticum]|uniref:Dolichyl-phosphate-mannose-protein mannosyltransferase n=1 Tax=Desulfurobacterium atlanticum TaxID=240169 RepID=A0A238Y8L2_9BACT|nr:glycosyltransferase family 39 protein [Desulfurobacterium atlanticum]SNR67360.1 Dolichyl-phosphate-mannose-protein mannosyltransferase [Desulfurobacterium atlanticum]
MDKRRFIFFILILLSVFVFFKNLGVNDIWIPNESFYAESAREMMESGNYLDIYYNYQSRFNKPPMTYWLVALSYKLFGISEFSARLPVVILSLFSVLLTYLIARELFDRKSAVYSAFAMFLSLQFVINSRYASPEDVLTFFFTLTLYLFIKGYKNKKFSYILLSYISLGLTVLTKGYPYIIVIGGIILLYILLENSFNFLRAWEDIKFLKLQIGIPLVLIIGCWWYVYMYLKFGNEFLNVLMKETIKRAVEKKDGSLNPFYYPVVILWGFLPYSLVAYFGLAKIKNYFEKLLFPFAWLFVMLVIFTLAKGKIPTYIIQAHPALSLITGYFVSNYSPEEGVEKKIYKTAFIIPAVVFFVATFLVVFVFSLSPVYYLCVVIAAALLIYFRELKLTPYISALLFFTMFTVSLLPTVEKFRPYDEIGKAIKKERIEKNVPLLVESYFWHNLPFYAERKVVRDVSFTKIKTQLNEGKLLALVKSDDVKRLEDIKILWKGKLYRRGSESRFAIFLKYVAKAMHGNFKGFEDRVLIYR